jgi:hypothetical protein
MRRGLEGWVKPTTGFKKPRAAKMGHFGRWDLQQWDALGPLLHSWQIAYRAVRARKSGPIDLPARTRAKMRPGGEALNPERLHSA